jgi:hypothetical protein
MIQPREVDKLISVAGLLLCVWAFIRFVQLPVEVLRAHPFSSILWLTTLCSLLACTEAVEHRHPWGLRAAVGMVLAPLLTVLANVVEWLLFGIEHEFLPVVPRFSRWTTIIVIALFLRLLDQQKGVRGVPVPRPVPRP